MVRHIVAWNHKDGFSEAENKEHAEKIKADLEALTQWIEGIIELRVHINTMPSGNRDVVLNSLFHSEEALAGYQTHPEHKKAASFIGAVMQDRICIDYFE